MKSLPTLVPETISRRDLSVIYDFLIKEPHSKDLDEFLDARHFTPNVVAALRRDDHRGRTIDEFSKYFSQTIMAINRERAEDYAVYLKTVLINDSWDLFTMLMLSLQPGVVIALQKFWKLTRSDGDVNHMIQDYRSKHYTCRANAYLKPKEISFEDIGTYGHLETLEVALVRVGIVDNQVPRECAYSAARHNHMNIVM
jgi:hypothetical protein